MIIGLIFLIFFVSLLSAHVGYHLGSQNASKPVIIDEQTPLEIFTDLMVESSKYWDTNPMRAMEIQKMAAEVLAYGKREAEDGSQGVSATSSSS